MNTRKLELRWLAGQRLPVWGGHIERGEPITDPGLQQMVDDGLVVAVEKPTPGYVITDKGRQYLTGD